MYIRHFKTEQFLAIDIDQAWDFFSSAKNLSRITPPEMGFNILTQLEDKEIYEGMKIDYTVKPLWGIPVHWQTEICKVYRKKKFTDKQLKGPYRLWEHTHTFSTVHGGVWMTDEINYQLPFGFIGVLFHSLVVRKKIEHIFTYRKQVLEKIFPHQ